MRILITGICGFVGATLARTWAERGAGHQLMGLDSMVRAGSETNRLPLKRLGVDVRHCDLRNASDLEGLPAVDWVLDAAANPSVLAGVDGRTSARQLVEHNLLSTLNVVEYCRRHGAGLLLLSTSRVYSMTELSAIEVSGAGTAFRPALTPERPWLSSAGVSEQCPTTPPLSLYGTTKIASEQLALEYGAAFDFPVWIDRCGVLAGAGQFGRADQGIFSYWIHSWAARRPLSYLGFDGSGRQVRDCLHPRDLIPLLDRQMSAPATAPRIVNVSGGAASATSLQECSDWCRDRFGPHDVAAVSQSRPFDIPWLVLDSSLAQRAWQWTPSTPRHAIFEEIADHAAAHPDWLETTA
jgi:CDP-paratose 2-epimerase